MNTHNLERVRKVKTRHQRLQMRVTTVREDIESFLQDDDDMMKLCLTRKKELEHMQQQQQLQQQQSRTDGMPSAATLFPLAVRADHMGLVAAEVCLQQFWLASLGICEF